MDVRFTDLKVYLWKDKSVSKMFAVRIRGEPPLYSGSSKVRTGDLFSRLSKMDNTKHLGSLTELQCITYLFGLGYDISIPYGDNSSYDFILDVNGKLLKLQCKTSRLKEDGVYKFECAKMRVNSKENVRKHYTENEVDYFCTFIQGGCYIVPFNECSDSKTLRFVPTKSGKVKGVSFAKDYEAEVQIEKIIHG